MFSVNAFSSLTMLVGQQEGSFAFLVPTHPGSHGQGAVKLVLLLLLLLSVECNVAMCHCVVQRIGD